ncbi:MAG: SCO1664 family protein [Anaerolineae bacterium]|nr:MAG: SCO1664 family protein [Anaerolineae bacterium]
MTPFPADLKPLFEQAPLELKGRFMLGSNYTFLVELVHESGNLPAVYKPIRGEQPLWDFPENTLAGREVAAYLVSEALGWELVPYTILRQDGPYGPGSLQEYIEFNPHYHYFSFKPADKDRLRPLALFDHLVNNADRKGSHIIIEKGTRHLYAIDHGLCFHEQDKLRTVVWDFAGEAIPEPLLNALESLRKQLLPGSDLHTALQAYLSLDEIAALDVRAQALLKSGCFPQPPTYRRAYPYPPL